MKNSPKAHLWNLILIYFSWANDSRFRCIPCMYVTKAAGSYMHLLLCSYSSFNALVCVSEPVDIPHWYLTGRELKRKKGLRSLRCSFLLGRLCAKFDSLFAATSISNTWRLDNKAHLNNRENLKSGLGHFPRMPVCFPQNVGTSLSALPESLKINPSSESHSAYSCDTC